MEKYNEVKEAITNLKIRGAGSNGVREYALDLLNDIEEESFNIAANNGKLEKKLLNGAMNWKEYSWGGCAFIYDTTIAERLCNKTELKRVDGGRKEPNSREQWLDVQARALFQAYMLILKTVNE